MKRVALNIKTEITDMDLVSVKFINDRRNTPTTHIVNETINKNIFVELFCELELTKLFGQKIFGKN